MSDGSAGLLITGIIALVIVLLVFGPMLTIWALNTLFGLGIPVNLATWFACLWLAGIVGATSYSSGK
jgi:hypothetical protein